MCRARCSLGFALNARAFGNYAGSSSQPKKKSAIPLIMLLEFGDYATKIPLQAIPRILGKCPKIPEISRVARRPLVIVVAMPTK